MDRIELAIPDTWHTHLRQEQLLRWMVEMEITNGFRGRILVKPNTKPEVETGPQASAYQNEIGEILDSYPTARQFLPVMTIQITPKTTPAMIEQAYWSDIHVGKIYPRNVTTNSEKGISDYQAKFPVLEAAQAWNMVTCWHCEHPSEAIEGFSKEPEFISILEEVRKKLPGLKIVVEHISGRTMRDWVARQPLNVRGTLAPQYAILTIDDIIGYSKRSGYLMRVHHGCKPQPKFINDRDAIREAMVSGDPHFFYGADDAPHLRKSKEKDGSACGVFNTPTAIPALIENVFLPRNATSKMNDFFSGFGADYYKYPRLTSKITFENNPWVVPAEYPVPGTDDSVVPFLAGETMAWKLAD